jgi:hypothetical protein
VAAAAVLRVVAFSALVTMSSAGVTSSRSHNAARTGSDSRSGVPVTSRWIWEADSVMPRSASSGARWVVVNSPRVAMISRSFHW